MAAIQSPFSLLDNVRHSFLTDGCVHFAASAPRVKRLTTAAREDASEIQRIAAMISKGGR